MEDEEEDQKNDIDQYNVICEESFPPEQRDVKLYSWGRNRFGQFNEDQDQDHFRIDPEPFSLSLISQIKFIACGIAHALVVD